MEKEGRGKDGSSTCILITNFPDRRPISGRPCHPSSSLKFQKMRPIFEKRSRSTKDMENKDNINSKGADSI